MPDQALSPVTRQAMEILGAEIRAHRIRRRWSVEELATRVGVSHPTITKVERGDPTVRIGTAFEAATIVGVALFGEDPSSRARHAHALRRELELLPRSARMKRKIDDDF